MTVSRLSVCVGSIVSGIFLAGCQSTQTNTGPMTPTPTPPTSPTYRTLASVDAPSSNVAILTLNSGTGQTSQIAGVYDHPSGNTTGGGYTAPKTNSRTYVASLSPTAGTGNNKIVAIPTLTTDMPTTGGATYNGTANFAAFDAANAANSQRGTMAATVTTNFSSNDVDIALSGANGQSINVNNLLISGNSYSDQASSVASAANIGAIPDYNAGTVKANGVFAGPQAAETGATVIITANNGIGTTFIDLTAGR